ncbi:hypothetical protein CVT26_010162 [Gymnopilus dilepis]|uniref:DUF6589 domain-containing protein n=1 Tax=Gymnopilus dilepis TaxID=231916 RepID=A0A409YS19_9AGAR|nr:hypothetical protein CVT26_010162 [Gymnopilus dilepis]
MPPPRYDSFAFSVGPAANPSQEPDHMQPEQPVFGCFSSNGTSVPVASRPHRQRASSVPWNKRGASQFRPADVSLFQKSPANSERQKQHRITSGQRSVEFAFGAFGGTVELEMGDGNGANLMPTGSVDFAVPYDRPLGQPYNFNEQESRNTTLNASPASHSEDFSASPESTSSSWYSAQSMPQSPLSPLSSAGHFSTPSLSPLILSGGLSRDSLSPAASTSSLDHAIYEPSGYIPRLKKPRVRKIHNALKALELLDEARITVIDLLEIILSKENEAFLSYRESLVSGRNQSHLCEVMGRIIDDEECADLARQLLVPRATKVVCDQIHREMEAAKPYLTMTSKEVTADFIDNWDLETIMGPVVSLTPTFSAVFEAAAESNRSKEKGVTPNARNRRKGFYTIHAAVHFLRSLRSSKVQIGLGLAAWACGASKEVLMLLHHAGLSMSYSSINSIVTALADSAIQKARKAASGPHGLAYDNINVSTSIFVEQRPGMPSKVQSGTFAVIYELLNARPEDLDIRLMMENLKKSLPLTLDDLQPTDVAVYSYGRQTAVNICQILFKHVKGFEDITSHTLLRHHPRRMIMPGHKTKFYPLRATTIEEASVDGNLAVHDDVYTVQLGLDPDKLCEKAIPSFNDQLTNARIRGAQDVRRKDVSPWERREIFQLGFGTFHLIMNLIWNVLSVHRGTVQQEGSLSYFFSVLQKKRLGSDHPDYHTLLTALTQVLEGLILNAWRQECGPLQEFAASNPAPEFLLQKAYEIADKYTIPKRTFPASNPKYPLKDLNMDNIDSNESDEDQSDSESTGCSQSESDDSDTPSQFDTAYQNIVLLTRDMLYVIELVNAVQTGDFGRVEDILPVLACMFRGSGSNNYSTEILHLLHNIKNVWTPEFANVMRDNMLINVSGLPEHAMPIDSNIEHLIGYLKRLFSAKGIYSNWDRLGNISAAIPHLQTIKRRVAKSTNAGYKSRSHKDMDDTELVWKIADKVRDTGLQTLNVRRDNKKIKAVVDMQITGYKKFESTALAAFNKKIEESIRGIRSEREVDDILPVGITVDLTDGDDELDDGQESVLHDCAD